MTETPVWFQYPEFSFTEKKATVIGGGIAGAQACYHLCLQGWHVTLIERHEMLATEASGNPAGVLSPKMTSIPSLGEDFYTNSFNYTLSLLNTLENQGKKIEWNQCGVIQIAHNQREEKRWLALKDRNLSQDFIQLLDSDSTSHTSGIELPYKSSYFPKGGWINPTSFTNALLDHPNCEIKYQSNVLSLHKQDQKWHVLDQQGKTITQSEVVIITNGKDLTTFEQTHFLPGMPVAGQTTSSTESTLSKKIKTVLGHDGYFTPSTHGKHIYGATFERNNKKPELTTESDRVNNQSLGQYLPKIAESITNHTSAHTAVRLTTPDRFPYVGALPKLDFYKEYYSDLHQGKQWKAYPHAEYQNGLFVLGGLGSRGLITSGYCATFLTNLISGDTETLEARQLFNNCHPARFIIKSLKQNKEIT